MYNTVDQLKQKNQILKDKLAVQELATSSNIATKQCSTMDAAVQANYLAIAPGIILTTIILFIATIINFCAVLVCRFSAWC